MVYAATEPHGEGVFDVGDGHALYWATHGNPGGKPAVMLHGGPGSGSSPGMARFFDPAAYRVVLLDQRNCGRSTPHASEPDVDLSTNTTPHLVDDLERLRTHLGIDRWLVSGASWGSVLALVYAQRYPERVTELVLAGVATGRRQETELLTRGLGPMFPDAWRRFRAGVPAAERDGDLAAAYHRLLFSENAAVRDRAARDWCAWEDAIVPTGQPSPRYEDPAYRLAFARIVTHYWANGSWLDGDAVLRSASRLAGIPGIVVQGRLDLSNLLGTPWELAAAWPDGELDVVDEAGHDGGDVFADRWTAALDRFVDGRGSGSWHS